MELDLLTAISPIDGRYRGKTDALAAYFSEFALIKYRVQVEVEYFITLCELPLPQLKGVDKGVFETLRNIYRNFSEADAGRIKDIESVTNHDVKAVEYFIKEKELDRHIREIKGILKEQLKVMLEELKKIPDIEVMNIPKGGFFLWVKLPEHIDGEYFYYKCKMNGVSILPGTIFYNNKKECNKIRLSFLTNNKEEIVKGVEIMKKIIIDKIE